MQLEGKRVVVTGAASGIGAALVAQLQARAAQVVAVDINAQGLAALPVKETHTADLTDPTQVDALLEAIGPHDCFIANAGFAYYEQLSAANWERIERIYRLNTFSPIYTLLALRQRYGDSVPKMVMVTSSMGHWALPGYALYGSTKAALNHFAASFRAEMDDPQQLMLVYPIATRTNFFHAANEKTAPMAFPSQTPDHVAAAILRGIERDQQAVYPSWLFRLGLLLDRISPFQRIVFALEKRRFQRWLRS